ncbi:MAG TPA: NAD(+)/NADH kinase [Fimbriimonadaceae bacterium]|nr:NAD(+)/NADH kinase [Fimbriimonadaceae bacterium]
MRAHLLINHTRKDALSAARKARDLLGERGVSVACDPESAPLLQLDPVAPEAFAQCDLVISFGGDGTLIRASHWCSEAGTPILGVYYGRFGFVTQCNGEDLADCLRAFVEGNAKFEERMMIQTDLLRGGKSVATIHSLNEMVVQRAVTVRMLTFVVEVDGNELTSYPADGVIVSTATGSTAYNLSAGGPILDPRVHALLLTALAPHTLSARPLVLHADSEIHLSLQSEGEAVLSADGQARLHLLSGDVVRVRKSPRITRLMTVQPDDFLRKLPQRLFWSQSILASNP